MLVGNKRKKYPSFNQRHRGRDYNWDYGVGGCLGWQRQVIKLVLKGPKMVFSIGSSPWMEMLCGGQLQSRKASPNATVQTKNLNFFVPSSQPISQTLSLSLLVLLCFLFSFPLLLPAARVWEFERSMDPTEYLMEFGDILKLSVWL